MSLHIFSPEASLKVLEIPIFVYSCSCKFILFSLILALMFFLPFYLLASPRQTGMPINIQRKERRGNETKLR